MAEPAESTILTSLRLTKALGLARQGKLKPAQLLLAPGNGTPDGVTELHALAALVTHEGDYVRALRLWQLLAQKQPDHSEARRMIPMIELWLSRPAWHRYVPFGLWAVVAVCGCGIAFWFLRPSSSPPPKKPATATSPSTAPAVTPAPAPATTRPANPPVLPPPIRAVPSQNQRTR